MRRQEKWRKVKQSKGDVEKSLRNLLSCLLPKQTKKKKKWVLRRMPHKTRKYCYLKLWATKQKPKCQVGDTSANGID